jgi:hypothetical protein
MVSWLVAVGVGIAFAFLQYGWRRTHGGPAPIVATALRVLSVSLIVAMLLDAAAAPARPVAPWVALDASASMLRGDSALWRAARDSVRSIRADTVLIFGDSARPARHTITPSDLNSNVRSAIDRAAASGHALVVITDGELDDPDAIAALPAGSRVIVVPRHNAPDVALTALDAPRAVVSGDTAEIRLTVTAGAVSSPAGTLTLTLDGRQLAAAHLDPISSFASRTTQFHVPIGGPAGPGLLQATVVVPGDVESRNDTVSAAIDRSPSASAVFVSTSPDPDARYAIAVLRGALAIPTRGFFRVAPNAWRVDGTLSAVSEHDVRTALHDAPLAVLQGDTAIFGPPLSATSGPVALVSPARDTAGEWYAIGTDDSPLSATLSGVAWDSLAPISVSGAEAQGSWHGVDAHRGRGGANRPIVVGREVPRRVIVVAASGLWRWSFRGGVASDAYSALWGAIFDWLAAERGDRRAAIPDAASFRAEQPIRWRRGSATDTLVAVLLRRRNGSNRTDSLTLRFGTGTSVVTSPPLAPGLYDVTTRGGTSLVAVNAASEWIPRVPTVHSGAVRGGVSLGGDVRVRGMPWLYFVIVVALCAEWIVRRRIGMR